MKFDRIEREQREFLLQQRIFFNASAASEGRVNVSPRDVASLRVLSANKIAYLDLTGSGNETAAHLLADGRLTLMFCSFETRPMIVRLYGKARIVARGEMEYQRLLASAFGGLEPAGCRQMVVMAVDLVQTSCGFGVPLFSYVRERSTLARWAGSKSLQQLEEFREAKNTVSMDGMPTGFRENVSAESEKKQVAGESPGGGRWVGQRVASWLARRL